MHSWDARLQDVRRLLKNSQELELSAAAVQRLKWFVYALEHEGNVSLTCRHFGIARSTFLRWAERFDAKNISTLEEYARAPHTVRTSDVDEETIHLIRMLRQKNPKMGKEQIQKILAEQYAKTISASTVGRIISRYRLFFGDTQAHQEKRGEHMTPEETSTSNASPTPETNPEESLPGGLPLSPPEGLTS